MICVFFDEQSLLSNSSPTFSVGLLFMEKSSSAGLIRFYVL